jgi:hypothetical protein
MNELLVSWPLGDAGDFEIRQGEHQDVNMCFRRSDHEWLLVPTSWDVLRSILPYIGEMVTLADAVVPLPLDQCGGGEYPRAADPSPDVRLLAQFARRHAAPHLPDGGNAA